MRQHSARAAAYSRATSHTLPSSTFCTSLARKRHRKLTTHGPEANRSPDLTSLVALRVRPSCKATPDPTAAIRTRQLADATSVALPIMSEHINWNTQPLADPDDFDLEEFMNFDWAGVDDAAQDR